MQTDQQLNVQDLTSSLKCFWELSGEKILSIANKYDHKKGSPVFTINGKYTTRGWTEWTQGFEFGSAVLQYEVTREKEFLEIGRKNTVEKMADHVSHFGVHDHGFNNISTYGNLLRLLREGKLEANPWEKHFYELALKTSGAVQAKRWTPIKNGGFIYSFNGPHSLFVDTIRTIRILIVANELGHHLMGENDLRVNLLERAFQHAVATAKYSIYYGEGRDSYDVWGRTAHESIFNVNDGNYRCPNAQQGFSGFTTWTRGLSWAMLGFAEELEVLQHLDQEVLQTFGGKEELEKVLLKAAKATCDFYLNYSAKDGIPYWDTGAANIHRLGRYQDKPADPFNPDEPVDSSAAAIGAQGLLRLGNYLKQQNNPDADKYWQAGLTVAKTLFKEPYLSVNPEHQGLILHSIYHRPNGWDHEPDPGRAPYGESSMWGDYHARELALYLHRLAAGEKYYKYIDCVIG
jgi:rhamnogalacturonyl hydrolase YesR